MRRNEENVFANASPGMPAVCSVCQLPAEFPNPDSPLELWTQYSEHNGKTYMTCSPGCKHVFDKEPEKYAQMWWPAEAYLSGEFGEDPVAGMFKYTGLSPEETGEHYTSREHAHWLEHRRHLGLDKKFF